MYVPANPTGMKRMLSDFSFFLSASIQLLGLLFQKKFDFIFAVAPSFQLGLLGVFYKNIRRSKLIYHIQDLQIEMAHELGMIKSTAVVHILLRIERFILKRCDYISTISEPMIQRVAKKVETEVILFPNWADNALFYPLDNKAALKSNFGYLAEQQVVLYSGAIGEKQGLEAILELAKHYKSNKSLMFAICGTGPYKNKLQQKTKEMELENVRFFQLQPKEHFNSFLNMADLHLIIQKTKASDLILPSKLTSILAVGGIALLTADEGSYLHALVTQHNLGVLVKSEDQEALNQGLSLALEDEKSEILRTNARRYAEAYLSIDRVMQTFEKDVLDTIPHIKT